MRLVELVFVIVIVTQIVSLSSAMEINSTESEIVKNDSIPNEDQNFSRFYVERSSYETKLTNQIPAPGKYENDIPPIGVNEVKYNSGNLALKAWLSDKPIDNNTHPAVVFAHNGTAFGRGDWDLAKEFINQDFILMTPMLRGENGNPGNFEFFYGEVEDLIAASNYLANISYVDDNRIFLCGQCSGGTLSMLASMMPSKYRAIASFGGSPDQKIFFDSGWGQIAPFDSSNAREIELRSPIVYVDSISKPLYIYVGDQDGYLERSRSFVEEAKNAGKPCKLIVVKGDHFSSVDGSIKLCINEFKNIQVYDDADFNRTDAYKFVYEGDVLLLQGNYTGAIEAYSEAIRLDPEYAIAWFNKGTALVDQGNYTEAIEALDEAIRLDPEFAEAWDNKGVALANQGNYGEAIEAFDEAIRLNPEDSWAWGFKGEVLRALGRTSEANFANRKARELGWIG